MAEKITVLIASVKEREEQLKIVLSRIYDKVDEIHLVLNWYEAFSDWLIEQDPHNKITAYLNSENKNAHDAIWNLVPKDGYVFILDDALLYPQDYFDKLIEGIKKIHNAKR